MIDARKLGIAVVIGLAIAGVDNIVAGGEVSPIVIVIALFVTSAVLGTLTPVGSLLYALAVWLPVPLVHLIKHLLRLPDTLHPNTYSSILSLGLFTLAVSLVGMACGRVIAKVKGAGPRVSR